MAVTTYIGLLRAVNIGAHNKVSMSALRELLGTLDLKDPRTLLQSGNVVFRSGSAAARLEKLLADATAKHLGVTTDFFVRTAAEWEAIIAGNPFPDEARDDPGHLLVTCLKAAPPTERGEALQRAIAGREVVRVIGREAYIKYPDGVGASKLSTAVIEKHLGTRGTARNWNTVLKLGALVAAP